MLAEKSDGPPPRCALVGAVNTFSENGTNFVGRLLLEGGVWRRTFLGFSQYQNGQYGVELRYVWTPHLALGVDAASPSVLREYSRSLLPCVLREYRECFT
eukprot:Tamp_19301.p4 GENE.Tamp_19301~~Tamp_19301.p4  ORF type:complete len:100 (+),score=1.06 Tamp_19301:103-402(+)